MRTDIFENKRLGLYFHIPFCLSKCAYCDFNSSVENNAETLTRYVSALISHMESYKLCAKNHDSDSVFIGGGTPTALPEEELIRLIRAIKKTFNLTKGAEFTVEANPATVSVNLLKKLRRMGVNRLSMGLQSADNGELKALSRVHTRQDFLQSYRAARAAGLDNINVDVMFGIPYQTFDSLMKTLDFVTRLRPEHISLYNLKIEPGTPFFDERKNIKRLSADEDTELAMYVSAIDFLSARGYYQYEISNFARSGYQCYHNLKYWNCEEYLGFGVSAHSYFDGNRFSIIGNIRQYMDAVEDMTSEAPLIAENERIEDRERVGEYVMLRFRLNEGLNSMEFASRFGVSFEKMYGNKALRYVKAGFMTYKDGNYALTPRGMFVSNYILSDILEFEDLGGYIGNI